MANKFDVFVNSAAKDFNVPEPIVRAVIERESGWKPLAVGSSGEKGLMQLMPATSASLGVRNPFDPDENIRAGTRFLADLYKRYGNWRDALSHYNGGTVLAKGRPYADFILSKVGSELGKSGSVTPILDAARRGDDPTKEPSLQTPVKNVSIIKVIKDWLLGNEVESGAFANAAKTAAMWIFAILIIIIGVWRLVNV